MATLSELLHAASRTFAIGIELLPDPLRQEVQVSYLLLRVSDYLEDNETMEPARKVRLLTLWAAVLAGDSAAGEIDREVAAELREVEDETPDALVARHVTEVLAGLASLDAEPRAVVVRHVRDSTLGMVRWVERGPVFRDEADLDDYMHEVAGRVGYLLTDLFSLHFPGVRRNREMMMELGQEFGLALQTVNVIRGLRGDKDRGWVFLPESFLPEGFLTDGRTPEDALGTPAGVHALDRLVAKAEHHFESARAYVRAIPRRHHRVRLFCLLPFFFGVRTLAISRSNPRVFREETKITRDEVTRIARSATWFGMSNAWVAWYSRRLGR
jgi:farnesyl-diphosphate farnesyltransferase